MYIYIYTFRWDASLQISVDMNRACSTNSDDVLGYNQVIPSVFLIVLLARTGALSRFHLLFLHSSFCLCVSIFFFPPLSRAPALSPSLSLCFPLVVSPPLPLFSPPLFPFLTLFFLGRCPFFSLAPSLFLAHSSLALSLLSLFLPHSLFSLSFSHILSLSFLCARSLSTALSHTLHTYEQVCVLNQPV